MQSDHLGNTLSQDAASDRDACLGRAQSGDGRAFSMLVEELSPAIEGSLVRFLHSDADAASAALQDAWTAACQRLSEFESIEHLIRWLHRVAKCKAISGLRKTRRLVPMSWGRAHGDSAGTQEPATRVSGTAAHGEPEVLYNAIACLPDTQRGIATLYYLHGQPVREVASLVRLPVTAVKMRLHRARQRLRRWLRSSTPS
jgi:RNA polymerase sigma-70 factor (ECF subfamily)